MFNWFRNLKVGAKINGGYILVLVLMAITSAVVLSRMTSLTNSFTFLVEHDQPVLANAAYLEKLVVDMETGQRGYIIVGKEEFLEPYVNGLTEFARIMEIEKELVSDNPPQVALLEEIEELQLLWVRVAAEPEIAKRDELNLATVSSDYLEQILTNGVGKDLMDRIRANLEELETNLEIQGDVSNIHLVVDILLAMVDQETGQRGFIITGQENFLEPYYAGRTSLDLDIDTLRIELTGDSVNLALLEEVELLAAEWALVAGEPEIGARRLMNENPTTMADVAALLEVGTGKDILDEIRAKFSTFTVIENELNAQRSSQATEQATSVRILLIGMTLAMATIGLSLGVYISRNISNNLKDIISSTSAVTAGNFDQLIDIDSRDEVGDLARAFNEMVSNLKTVTVENERRIWQATGQTELNEQMRGEQDLTELSATIIGTLCRYLDAQVGALYIHKDEVLSLIGSYAYNKRKNLSNQFKLGEGLVGQAALEKKPIMISNAPEDYIQVQSGLGDAPPGHIIVMPFLYENRVDGVIELATITEWNDEQLGFLESVAENIAVVFNMAHARTRMQELLDETQNQTSALQGKTEEMEAQAEELRQTNDELGEQTGVLEESEHKLKQQQEELQVTNEELEEKTEKLERQRIAVNRKNRELEKAQAELEQRAKDLSTASKYKSEFLANMSHELRTPLNSLLILARLLAENKEGNLSSDQIDSAQVIFNSGNDLLALINEILDLAKVESGKMERRVETVSLADLQATVEREFSHVAKDKGLSLQTHLSPNGALPRTIQTDRQRVEQIIKNLLSNAFKFTSTGGVTVTFDRPEADVNLYRSGLDAATAIAISVTDTGIGISPDQNAIIFEAFQQEDGSTSREYGGTGLGLTISRELAEFLGGEIVLQSVQGQGSTFTLYLPEISPETDPVASESEAPVQRPGSQETPTAPARGVKKPLPSPVAIVPDDRDELRAGDQVLLIVEDDANFAKILTDFGRRKNFKCLVAGSGEEGLSLAQEYRPAAILLDLQLPGIDGWGVLAALKEDLNTRHIPVHIMSVLEETAQVYQRGAIGYLSKPAAPKELDSALQTIEDMLAKDLKTLLIVEDDKATQMSLKKLFGNGDIKSVATGTGKRALQLMKSQKFDCLILDLKLPDMTGFDFLGLLEKEQEISKTPVIIYTGMELTRQENEQLMKYADSVIIKGVKSQERLLDETALFLHRVVADLPDGQQEMIRELHDTEKLLKDKKILLVDDDVRGVFALSKLLTGKGLQVEMATDGQKALHYLAEEPDVDLVLMDVMMPVMDGLETTRRIREMPEFKNLPILVLTAKAMKGDREKCIAAGANDYLSKPIDPDRLLAMMQIWLYR